MSSAVRLERLLAFIQEKTGADAIEALDFQPLSGGAIQENEGLDVRLSGGSMPGEHRFVVRSDAEATLAQSLSRWQEFEVLREAYAAGVCAPEPLWSCRDPSVLGVDFYIMRRAAGSASGRALARDEGLSDPQRQALLFDLGQNLARLHQVRPAPGRLPFLEVSGPDAGQQRLAEYRAELEAMNAHYPALELGLRVLREHALPASARVLCHGDFRTGNYMVDHGQLTAILDWEFASWGDPYEDLGWLCARSWRFGHPERPVGGVGQPEDLYAGYQSITGHAVDPVAVAWWALMASVRWAIIAHAQAQRHLSGQQVSIELALTGRMLPEIQLDLMMHLREFLVLAGQPEIPFQIEEPVRKIISAARIASPASVAHQSGGDQPSGADLLSVARETLLDSLLPSVPRGEHYNARMIANAMAMAQRELTHGAAVQALQQQLVAQFCQACGLGSVGLSAIVQAIRHDGLTPGRLAAYCRLIDQWLALKLVISNPKRVPAC